MKLQLHFENDRESSTNDDAQLRFWAVVKSGRVANLERSSIAEQHPLSACLIYPAPTILIMTGTGQQIKAAAIAKAKSAVNSATNGSNGSASKKRRGNNQLKPIITTSESQQDAENASSVTATNST